MNTPNSDKDGGPAFPAGEMYQGMTLLDWFAGQALRGIISDDSDRLPACAAYDAYKFAMAMLVERNHLTNTAPEPPPTANTQ